MTHGHELEGRGVQVGGGVQGGGEYREEKWKNCKRKKQKKKRKM